MSFIADRLPPFGTPLGVACVAGLALSGIALVVGEALLGVPHAWKIVFGLLSILAALIACASAYRNRPLATFLRQFGGAMTDGDTVIVAATDRAPLSAHQRLELGATERVFPERIRRLLTIEMNAYHRPSALLQAQRQDDRIALFGLDDRLHYTRIVERVRLRRLGIPQLPTVRLSKRLLSPPDPCPDRSKAAVHSAR